MENPSFVYRYFQCRRCKSFLRCSAGFKKARCPGCQLIFDLDSKIKNNATRKLSIMKTLNMSTTKFSKLIKYKTRKKRETNLNSYMVFCMLKRNELVKKTGCSKFGIIGSMMGKIWKEMSEEEKKPYLVKCEEMKQKLREKK